MGLQSLWGRYEDGHFQPIGTRGVLGLTLPQLGHYLKLNSTGLEKIGKRVNSEGKKVYKISSKEKPNKKFSDTSAKFVNIVNFSVND